VFIQQPRYGILRSIRTIRPARDGEAYRLAFSWWEMNVVIKLA
jgi:hypothetical protein